MAMSESYQLLKKDSNQSLNKPRNDEPAPRATGLVPGVVMAGPGEDRLLIKFDVKAFFENRLAIQNIGKRNNKMTFRISGDAQIMKEILKAHGFTVVPMASRFANLNWIGNAVSELYINQMRCYQVINHFVWSSHLTRKDLLYKNVSKMKEKAGADNFGFLPISFILPKEKWRFKSYFKKNPGSFIVKPVGLSRGRGVYLIDKPEDITDAIDEEVIVSKYIENPLVIDGYKMDLRIYVLVTSFDPLVIYIYREGLARFATVKYSSGANNLSAIRMHLTNYSINSTSGNYIKNEDSSIEDFGNKWTLSALLRYFQSKGINTIDIMSKVEEVVVKTILSVEKPMAKGSHRYIHNQHNCFEIFGFDILFDEHFKPWLLEVNLSPSLVCTTPLDIKVKANMLCDLLNLVGVEAYPKHKQSDEGGCCNAFDDYVHRTVGYFVFCCTREWFRHAFLRRKKRRRYQAIIDTYKQLHRASSKEHRDQITRQRARMFDKITTKERKMLIRVSNEESRCGGWVRIFPIRESWAKYGHLLEYPSSLNVILHQRLYPDEHLTTRRRTQTLNDMKISASEETILKNSKWRNRTNLSLGMFETVARMKLYQTSLKIGPHPLFRVRRIPAGTVKGDAEQADDDYVREQLLYQILKGRVFSEIQARTAFLKYLTNLKRTLRECSCMPLIPTCPPVEMVEDLLFRLLGQTSELVIDKTKPFTEYSLDSCLTSFVYHYHQETRRLIVRAEASGSGDTHCSPGDAKEFVSQDFFEEFLHSANPWQLQRLLVSYLEVTGDPSIFMKHRIQNGSPTKTGAAAERDDCTSSAQSRKSSRLWYPMSPQPGETWTTV